jgi:hypothetical protein
MRGRIRGKNLKKMVCGVIEAARTTGMFSGFCYTQFADTFQEVNGLLYADRTPKIPTGEHRGGRAWTRAGRLIKRRLLTEMRVLAQSPAVLADIVCAPQCGDVSWHREKKAARGKSSSERESLMSNDPGRTKNLCSRTQTSRVDRPGGAPPKAISSRARTTGQDRYGQSGLGGKGRAAETNGQASYRQQPSGDHESNRVRGGLTTKPRSIGKKPGVDRKPSAWVNRGLQPPPWCIRSAFP